MNFDLAGEIVQTISHHVGNPTTKALIYEDLIHTFKEFGLNPILDCQGIDPVFDDFLREESEIIDTTII